MRLLERENADGPERIPDAEPDARMLAAIRQTFRRMPKLTRTVFELHRHDGLDYPAIAARLRISVAEVERHVSLALRQLWSALHHLLWEEKGARAGFREDRGPRGAFSIWGWQVTL